MVGYPSFIADNRMPCAYNAGALNGPERDMINKGVTHMNKMLQKAAHEKQVNFVDIEDSLHGGRLCEGSEYVTGLHDLGFDKIVHRTVDESFHPNTSGHSKIAEQIIASNAFTSDTTPELSQYSPSSDATMSFKRQLVTKSLIVRGSSSISIAVEPYSFSPSSTVSVKIYSEPIDLGGLTTAGNGSLSGEISLTDTPIGRHVLVISGDSYSGEPIRYFQFIEIAASADDNDGDGTFNKDDPCDYVQHWHSEQTGRDQCEPAVAAVVSQENKVALVTQGTASEIVGRDNNDNDENAVTREAVLGQKDSRVEARKEPAAQYVHSAIVKSIQVPWVFIGIATSGIIGGMYVIKRRNET